LDVPGQDKQGHFDNGGYDSKENLKEEEEEEEWGWAGGHSGFLTFQSLW